ncbi:hypothetical protein METBIDRAFT_30360 [Metschnikowia bicuspidata var. bicuspidata NRRL YB-4993]|uniref:Large ribosomal subunit protein mL46 n=1 Tax=Metschnikowia bicuspidata var. bicuspidata NRRL YB-4993 TaxID=869754 RepID=A0A1A0HJD9_9ASCO|nr:hypothetical protein METBIDRAFT_30360 [Metschnikowia bicuspidata var. bicuspidata NRRL YB-4993]OBA24002.1 hypothetical protein METBIDRAFT_30360 [Metschnikowia bicuspidata var. bicuspidata NRRL YB-4993]
MWKQAFIRWNSTAAAVAPVQIRLTLLLLRIPVVSADLPVFQQQYYKYQNELWKRLMWTFPKWFYFREGTLAEQKYRELNKDPVFNNPNLEFTGGRPEIRHQRDRRFKQDVLLPKTYKEGEETTQADAMSRKIVPNLRTTDADRHNDESSLERRLARTLYLVVSADKGQTWGFPTFASDGQALHTTAEAGLYALGGTQINYFNVSPKPCHVLSAGDSRAFFIKLHILSGVFQPAPNTVHKWLAKDELAAHLDELYYNDVCHLLSEV